MKIVITRLLTMHFHQAYDGGAKLFQYLSEYLVKKGMEVTIITTPFKKGDYTQRTYNGVKYVFIPPYSLGSRLIKLNVPYKLVFSYNLLKYLKKEEFDILHSSEAFAFFYLMKKKRNPVITQAHGLEPFYGPESLSQRGLKKLYVKLFLKIPWLFCLKKSECVGSLGKVQQEDLEKIGIETEKITPIPNGIYLEGIEKLKKRYKNKRKEHGIGEKDLLILNVNQIAPDKRVEDIVDAFYILKKEIKKAKLIIIGKGSLERKIDEKIKILNLKKDIIRLKNISEQELYNYYLSADIFVNASLQEDFIMSIQEAMACGLPVVSSNQPFLVKDGLNGYVVGPNNPEGISKGIMKIYLSGGEKMKKMGEESVKMAKQYDYEAITNIAIKIYNKLIKQNKEKVYNPQV